MTAANAFDRTYEGLKLGNLVLLDLDVCSFDRTYEGLKRGSAGRCAA